MTDKEKHELLRAYFAGQWMIAMALSGNEDIKAEDCWGSADAMLEKMAK